jgi:hypothetical protein
VGRRREETRHVREMSEEKGSWGEFEACRDAGYKRESCVNSMPRKLAVH